MESRGSCPQSGHRSDITTANSQQQQPVPKVDRVTRSAMGKVPLSLKPCERLQKDFNFAENLHLQPCTTSPYTTRSPPTPHKIVRVKEGFGNPLQIPLTPKKNSVNKLKISQAKPTHSSYNDRYAPSPSSRAGKLVAAAESSHKVAEYVPIRRSKRKPRAKLLQEQMEGIEARLMSSDDSQLDIEIRHIENKGRGIVAKRDFVKGEFIVEYAGELIDIGTAKELESKYSMDTSKGCYMYYFKHKGKQYW